MKCMAFLRRMFLLQGLCNNLEVKHNVHLQSQDVHSHRVSYRKEVTGGLSEEDATYRLFQDVLKKDTGAVIEVVCDSRNAASIMFVQTSQRKEILCRYSSVIFLDTSLRGEHKISVISASFSLQKYFYSSKSLKEKCKFLLLWCQ